MRKGQIFRAKKRNKWILGSIPIVGYLLYNFFYNILFVIPPEFSENTSIMIFISIFTLLFLYMYIMVMEIFNWSNIKKRKEDLEKKRLVYYYNRCIKYLEEKNYIKVNYFFNNGLYNYIDTYPHFVREIRLSYLNGLNKNLDNFTIKYNNYE